MDTRVQLNIKIKEPKIWFCPVWQDRDIQSISLKCIQVSADLYGFPF